MSYIAQRGVWGWNCMGNLKVEAIVHIGARMSLGSNIVLLLLVQYVSTPEG